METNKKINPSPKLKFNDGVKICHLITQTHFGGAQKYICDIVNNLDDSFDITIAFGEGSVEEFKSHITNPQIKFKKLKFLGRNINIFKDKLAWWEIFFFCLKNKFDILHLHSSKAGFIGAWAGKWAGIDKIIYTAHGWVFKEKISSFKKNLYLFLEKFSSKFKNHIICISQNDYDLALKHKISPEDKLLLVYNGIQTNTQFMEKHEAREFIFNQIRLQDKNQTTEFNIDDLEINSDKPISRYIPLDENTKIIGTISNLYPNKNIETLIHGAPKLNTIYRNLIFVIIGSGPEKEKLEKLVKEKKLHNFYFLGKINQASKYLKAFDIFTLASTKEGLPYTLLEALQAQISIICSNLDSLVEIIQNNENGLIFKAQNSDDLVYKIQSLLNNPSLAQKLKSNNGPALGKFNFDKFITNIQNLYLN
jgi:glycosyltransferase involved in cell wall biosynthesis